MRSLVLFSALCLGVSAVSHADTVFYAINNTYEGNGVATGTVGIDTASGNVNTVNMTFTQGGTSYVFTGAPFSYGQVASGDFEIAALDGSPSSAATDTFTLELPVDTLVGYAGGRICTNDLPCANGNVGGFSAGNDGPTYLALTGSLATTPEPSSLVLLGTGLLATVSAVRRRAISQDL